MYKNTKLYSVLSYITWIGWFVALLLRDKADGLVRHHLNQALIINICSLVASFLARANGLFGTIGTILDLGCLVLAIMGIVRALQLSDAPLPVIGNIRLL